MTDGLVTSCGKELGGIERAKTPTTLFLRRYVYTKRPVDHGKAQ
jgi:hypothetical protein